MERTYMYMWEELKEKVERSEIILKELEANANQFDEKTRLKGKVDGLHVFKGWMDDLERVVLKND